MPHTAFLPRPAAAWSAPGAADTIRTWQRLLPWERATVRMPGTRLCEQSSASSEVFLLERGFVKLSCMLPNGQPTLLSLRLPGQLIGDTCVHLLSESYPVSVTAATECRVSRIQREAMQQEVNRNPEAAQFLLRQQSLDLYQQAVALIEARTLTTAERFAQCVRHLTAVLELPRTRGPRRLLLPLSDAETASLLGVTREYFNRLKKQLQSEGRFRWEGRTLVILRPVFLCRTGAKGKNNLSVCSHLREAH